ncbi:halocyanin domain-containing protein [Halorarius litoreus]|uniref:halocyanin domain-containing protein n=1 Tax=Halorarius litoreus TaxID=2962676 RepID=UPI0020CC37B0|nr:halocyanin domain-containing protein [Halorarius litoreus]
MRGETRRTVLKTAGAVGLLGLAGCSGNGGGAGVDTGTPTSGDETTPTATPEMTPETTETTPTEGDGMAMDPADAVDTWLTETEVGGADDTYDGTIEDLTGQETVTVMVGTPGNGGAFAFSPSAARVSVGTEIQFEWTGEGGVHNVEALPAEQLGLSDYEFSSGEPMQGEGVQYTRTMDVPGVLLWHCEPHLSLGMKGGIVVE